MPERRVVTREEWQAARDEQLKAMSTSTSRSWRSSGHRRADTTRHAGEGAARRPPARAHGSQGLRESWGGRKRAGSGGLSHPLRYSVASCGGATAVMFRGS
jgi:hypothetical protein